MSSYYDIAFTDSVKARQEQDGSRAGYESAAAKRRATEGLGPDEVHFLSERDSVFIATVSESGWPYVQHRGGNPGFLAVLDPHTLVWAERRGNRQFISAGNLDHDGKLALIAVDYPNRRRLKLFGQASLETEVSAELASRLGFEPGEVAGIVRVHVLGYDWNCPKYITPRYTEAEWELLRPTV